MGLFPQHLTLLALHRVHATVTFVLLLLLEAAEEVEVLRSVEFVGDPSFFTGGSKDPLAVSISLTQGSRSLYCRAN